ncbi:hypothetical protein GCM10007916_00060 [Psychromonas marina]|uniref:Uncharacterized protein n=1 Tax=Psychromonas marina TaxID=88364 RepID=A0ABQ6DUX9_9GAMM|nr:hypothetical protein [Psychromonas marina]GLS88939.1 hypothetical protein GCM10007916_00060 [Psychromonas marina]
MDLSNVNNQQLELFSSTKQNNELMQVLVDTNQCYVTDSAFIAEIEYSPELLTPQ